MPLPDWLYTGGPNALWVFVLLTLAVGSSAAFVSGFSIAATWRPFWQVPAYVAGLTFGVRFLHYALFNEAFLPLNSVVADFCVLLAFGAWGFVLARGRQMARQYAWLQSSTKPATSADMPVN